MGTRLNSPDFQQTVGRFAPSPTGNLHIGSLITAVASFCMAKKNHGRWLLRIEDIDSERCKPEFSEQILTDLTNLGLHWDGEVYYQSKQLDLYHDILNNDLKSMTYACDCSRKSIQNYCESLHIPTHIYPKLCQDKNLPRHHAIRLVVPDKMVDFFDTFQGKISTNPQQTQGDIVLRRKQMSQNTKGMINYMLAVVVDDIYQGVNQIVRGLDILPLTSAQLILYEYLNKFMVKEYAHLPILTNDLGQKLSKQTLAEPICQYNPSELLALALQFLGQKAVEKDKPEMMLKQAITQWDNTPLIGKQQIVCPPLRDIFALSS